MTCSLFKRLDFSDKRRVLAVGDIHGEFTKFEKALSALSFSPEEDVVVSLGDLIDRGQESEAFEDYLNKPWFHRVLGNHDLQPREYLLGWETSEAVAENGGEWFLVEDRDEIDRIATLLEAAPLALEVLTPGGHTVGFTHADCSTRWNWMEGLCADPDLERYMVNLLTGSRRVIRKVQSHSISQKKAEVGGIDHVFHGHTTVEKPLTFANRTWIDTQVDGDAPLTVLDVDVWVNAIQNKPLANV